MPQRQHQAAPPARLIASSDGAGEPLIQPARALNGATMTNAQPPPLPVAGLPLARSAELLAEARPKTARGSGGDPPEYSALAAGAGLAGGGRLGTTVAALVGAGAGTDETCEW